MPPMMPVMMPAVGGMPDAIEMPMHSGKRDQEDDDRCQEVATESR